MSIENLSKNEYIRKHNISVSTLRRRVKEGSVKMINQNGSFLYCDTGIDTGIKPNDTGTTENDTGVKTNNTAFVESLQGQVEFLKSQLIEKDKQIGGLLLELNEQRQEIKLLTEGDKKKWWQFWK